MGIRPRLMEDAADPFVPSSAADPFVRCPSPMKDTAHERPKGAKPCHARGYLSRLSSIYPEARLSSIEAI